MSTLLFVTFLAILLVIGLRWFIHAPVSDLAQAARTFLFVFSALASSGLIYAGRFGLALVTLAATVMAVRSFLKARRGADPFAGDGGQDEVSQVTTRLLRMELNRRSGRLDGTVLGGSFEGRRLDSLGLAELQELLAEFLREDPDAAKLLEAYLDRRDPTWRAGRFEEESGGRRPPPGAGEAVMDERTALAVLGLREGASAEEIKAAHRRLMAKLHPDHGGSNYLATQINRAKETLLRGRR